MLYPSFSPQMLLFLGMSSAYGLWKTGKCVHEGCSRHFSMTPLCRDCTALLTVGLPQPAQQLSCCL